MITQASDNSGRPTVIADSHFTFVAPGELTNATVKTPVTFVDTVLDRVGGMKIAGSGAVTFRGSTLNAADDAAPIEVAGSDVSIKGGTGVSRTGDGELHLTLSDSSFRAEGSSTHVAVTKGATHYRAVGNRFEGGALELADAAFGGSSTLLHTGNVESGVTRTAFPAEGDRVVDTANLLV